MFREIEIDVVSHGHSDMSVAGHNPPLDRDGREQVKWIVRALAEEHHGDQLTVLTSELLRAQQTGRPICERFDVKLIEVQWGYSGPDTVSQLVELVGHYDTPVIVLAGHIPTVQRFYALTGGAPPRQGVGPGEIHRFRLTIRGWAAALEPLGVLPAQAE